MTSMKIAFIGQKGIPTKFGGVERHVEELSVRLSAAGQQVFVYCRPWYTTTEAHQYRGVRLVRLSSLHTKHLDAISHTLSATIHALFQPYDIIHYHGVGPALLAWLPRLCKPRCRVVVTFHCIDRKHQKWNWFARLALRLGEWAACVFAHQTIAVSQTLQQYCRDVYDTETVYIPNGVPLPPEHIGSALMSEQFGLQPNRYILAVSRLVRHKGIHHLIAAYQQVATDLPLVIVGGSAFTDDYVAELQRLAAGSSQIRFVGYQEGAVLAELFAQATLFVQPSETEGLPITLLEAMAYGRPVIASDIAENQEALGGCGLLFHNRNIQDLAKKLTTALADPVRMHQFARAARQRVRVHYRWEDIVGQTERLYRTIVPAPAIFPAATAEQVSES